MVACERERRFRMAGAMTPGTAIAAVAAMALVGTAMFVSSRGSAMTPHQVMPSATFSERSF